MRRMNPAAKAKLPAAQPRSPEARPRQQRKVPRRRPAPPRWRRQVLRYGGFAVLLLSLCGGTGWAWHTKLPQAAWQRLTGGVVSSTADAGFALRQVVVEGRQNTPRDVLLADIGLKIGQPMLSIDPQALKARLETIGWVRSATVERRLPDEIYIKLIEAEPLALWQRDSGFQLLDRDGHVISQAGIGGFTRLPVLVGDTAPDHATELFAMLAREPDLAPRVKAAVWVGERRWNLRFDNGVDVELPAESPQLAWSLLARLEREQRLLARDVTSIDMRLPDRLIVRLGPSAALQHQGGSNT
jgi:cell division protein FtsQ